MSLRTLPAALWACAAIAFVHAACWAALTPPFQVPDEFAHAGYVQYIAETGKLPRPDSAENSDEINAIYGLLPFGIERRPTWRANEARALFRALDRPGLSRYGSGEAGSAVNYPPLYYAAEAVPYRVTYGLDFLDRLFFMRLFSALLAAGTVGFVFLFLRELLPGTPWTWTVGALAVAFQPVFAFMSGGVNNDDLLYMCGAALLYLVARAFRRGLTVGLGLAIGVAAMAGVLTKQSMAGLFPGVALGLLWLIWKAPAERRGAAVRGTALAGAIVIVPAVFWVFASSHLVGRPSTSVSGGLTSSYTSGYTSWSGTFSYLWQVVFPPLPSMNDQINHWIPWWAGLRGFVGTFGWFEASFQSWVYWLATAIFAAITVLAGAELWRRRDAVRRRWAELATYALMTAGLMLVIELSAYRYFASNHQYFEQPRYLFPLLGLYAAFVSLGARGAGRRWGPAVGGFMVVLFMGHSLFAMFLAIGRWYA